MKYYALIAVLAAVSALLLPASVSVSDKRGSNVSASDKRGSEAQGPGERKSDTQAPGDEVSGKVVLTARFPADTEEISGIFKRSLPDSGVVPVAVTISNETDTTITVHASSGLELGGNFDGFSLITGGNTYLPVHPMEALMRALAAEKGIKYRKPGFWGLTLGILVVPGLGIYYIYKEIVSGRFYRPIFNNSLYPSQSNWSMDPIEIEPGGDVEGFLYFVLPSEANPYPVADSIAADLAGIALMAPDSAGADSMAIDSGAPASGAAESAGREVSFELHLKACIRHALIDSIPLDELLLVRNDGGGLNDGRDRFFALRRNGKSRKKRMLVFGSLSDLGRRPHDAFDEAANVTAKSATIADASSMGDRTACALNFKSKSKVYLVEQENDRVLVQSRGFERNIKRAFVIDDGVLVVMENGFCHYLTGKKLRTKRRVNFPRGVEDAAIIDGRLHVMHKSGIFIVYGLNGDTLLKELDRHSFTKKGKGKIVGSCSGRLTLLREGSRIAGDTLLFVDSEDMETAALLMVPGRVEYASCSAEKTILQLENGTVLLLALDKGGSYTIGGVYYVPFPVKTFFYYADEITAVGADGALMRGPSGGFYPGAAGVHEVTEDVGLPLIH